MNGIRDLRNLSRRDVKQFGGKAVHLGELINLGVQVPSGFCISHQIIVSLTTKSDGDVEGCDNCFKDKLAKTIAPHFDGLVRAGLVPLAVRSSASGEDSAVASFAGQFESILGVYTLDELCNAIISCWKSSHSSRVMSYMRKRKLSATPMSVIVQRLVIPKTAGVCFTCHPITLEANTIVIEANWGFGDSVVAGVVSPDHFEIDTVAHKIKVQQITCKRRISTLISGRVKLITMPDAQQYKPCLNEEEIWKIVDTAMSIQKHFKSPQDIEWALVNSELFILQSRPVTGARGANQRKEKSIYV